MTPDQTQLHDDLMQWRRQGATVELVDGDQLRYHAPNGCDATALQTWLREHKPDLLLLLRNLDAEPDDDGLPADATGQTSSLSDCSSAQLMDHANTLIERDGKIVGLPMATLTMMAAQVAATRELTREVREHTAATDALYEALTREVRAVYFELEGARLEGWGS